MSHVFSLTSLLEQEGHEVRHFAMHHPENLECEDSRYWVEEIDFAALNERKTLRSSLRVAGRAIYSPETAQQLSRMLDDWMPDVAHVHSIHGHLSPSVLRTLRHRQVPVVWTLHDFRLLCPNSTFLSGDGVCERCAGGNVLHCITRRCKKGSIAASTVAALESAVHRLLRIQRWVDVFVAPSMFLQGKMVQYGVTPDRIVFVRNGLGSQWVPHPASIGGPALFVGRLSVEKGVHTVLRALAALPEGRLEVAGGGPEEGALKELSKTLGLDARVSWLGRLGTREVEEALSRAAYVVVPSRWYENCPYSVMEAQASGLPVIASRLGGLPELVEDGVSGLLADAEDVQQWAEHMQRLWADRELAERLHAGAVRKAAEYDLGLFYSRIMDVYEMAIRRSEARRRG
ncbi:MAG: glycosyltransferase [Coriobacteriia bacterium]|nr:glycosyltransferase [Coriobacteriia bacterium]